MKSGSLEGTRRKASGPIGIYRDQWGALENKKKLAYFCAPGLPTDTEAIPVRQLTEVWW
jgi:hypothetical protein